MHIPLLPCNLKLLLSLDSLLTSNDVTKSETFFERNIMQVLMQCDVTLARVGSCAFFRDQVFGIVLTLIEIVPRGSHIQLCPIAADFLRDASNGCAGVNQVKLHICRVS